MERRQGKRKGKEREMRNGKGGRKELGMGKEERGKRKEERGKESGKGNGKEKRGEGKRKREGERKWKGERKGSSTCPCDNVRVTNRDTKDIVGGQGIYFNQSRSTL